MTTRLLVSFAFLCAAATTASAAPPVTAASFRTEFLNRYCVTCHNQRLKTGALALDDLDVSATAANAPLLEKVVQKLRGGQMPPAGQPRPPRAEYEAHRSWLESALDRAAAASPNPGRTETFHLLNRTEYHNAVRDLLALDVDVTTLLPADDQSYGFDNIAGVLKINQPRMERYLSAASTISRMAVGRPVSPATETYTVSPDTPQYRRVEGLPFGTRGGTLIRYNFPQDGEYAFEIKLLGTRTYGGDENCDGAGGFPETHLLDLLIDGVRVQRFTLPPRALRERFTGGLGKFAKDKELEVERYDTRIALKAGVRDVAATFVAHPRQEFVEPGYRLRFERPFNYGSGVAPMPIEAPFVHKVLITGPFVPAGAGDTVSRQAILSCAPAAASVDGAPCARTITARLARLAYRRPVADADVGKLMVFYERGRAEGGFETGVEYAIGALLVSPEFLFRIERQPVTAKDVYRMSDLDLASRLSFFLWSSVPDDELLEAASAGRLRTPVELRRQVRRMLASPKAQALTTSFAAQWLQLPNLRGAKPLQVLFPDFDESLRDAFRQETELFVDSIVRQDRSALELLTADYTFVNERLARHYGIRGVQGSHFRRVQLADGDPRRGLLGQGSVLTITSYANRNSPVRRGKWILDTILGTPPPPPPANVPPLPEKQPGGQVLSVRELMAQHRKNPVCATCHATIDPLGFALDNFDPVGRFRRVDTDTYAPLDTSGTFPDGMKFTTLAEFKTALVTHPDRFVVTLTTKLLTYALGRGLEYYDMPAVRRIVRDSASHDYRISSIIAGIAESLPFQMRRPALPEPMTVAGQAR